MHPKHETAGDVFMLKNLSIISSAAVIIWLLREQRGTTPFVRRFAIADIFFIKALWYGSEASQARNKSFPERRYRITWHRSTEYIAFGFWNTCRSDLKPDIVLLEKSSKTAVIVEITVSFNGPNSTLKATREAKRDKYRVFEPELKRLGYKKIVVDALVVGALEAFDPDNSRVLSALKILRRYVRLIKGSQYLGRSRKAEIFTYSHNLS